ncbi:unnamed protein product [Phytophthora fragariaefolia]|uniref:Unnamed protein product n=1 Tax=Phytophthora fragariaefolia TaxID=1490495 RepID=A0A9W6Y3U2_9STRA|nr:unnamed protein product [Phytophthora fragariaefolia]
MVISKLRVRLRIACQKVMTVDQRSLIAGSVIIPNLLYIARHEWPTTADVNDMDARISNFVWHGQFVKEITGVRAWLDADLAALPRTEGGLAIPDLRAEHYALAAMTVRNWAELGTQNMHIVGDLLFHNNKPGVAPRVYILPDFSPPSASGFQRRNTQWTTGRALLARAGTAEPQGVKSMKTFLQYASGLGGIKLTWMDHRLTIDCTALLVKITRCLSRPSLDLRGLLHLEWLPHAMCDTLQEYTTDGKRMPLDKACGSPLRTHQPLSAIATWQRSRKGYVEFDFMGLNTQVA